MKVLSIRINCTIKKYDLTPFTPLNLTPFTPSEVLRTYGTLRVPLRSSELRFKSDFFDGLSRRLFLDWTAYTTYKEVQA